MSLYQVTTIAASSVPNPPLGAYTLFLDTDGTWKKKDSLGAISATGSGFYNENGTLSGDRAITLGTYNAVFNSDTQPGLFVIDGLNDKIGAGIVNPSSKLHIKGSSSITSASPSADIGLDDLTVTGTFTGTVAISYRVKIDASGTPDTFTWSADDGATWEATGVAITGNAQTLNYGVTITFTNTTAHTVNDYWDFTATPNNPLTITDESGNDILAILNDGRLGIGTITPDASAILECQTTTQGVLFPRMTEVQRDAIAAPAAGLVIYNTTTNKLNLRVAAAWEAITST